MLHPILERAWAENDCCLKHIIDDMTAVFYTSQEVDEAIPSILAAAYESGLRVTIEADKSSTLIGLSEEGEE